MNDQSHPVARWFIHEAHRGEACHLNTGLFGSTACKQGPNLSRNLGILQWNQDWWIF